MNIINSKVFGKDKKLGIISFIFLLVGAVVAVCLIYYFIALFNERSRSMTPQIFDAEQIGATDTSVLLSWSCSEVSRSFVVKYFSSEDKSSGEIRTDSPFAAIHELKPFTHYSCSIIPVKDETEYKPYSFEFETSPYCHVTEVSVSDVTENSADISWKYSGVNNGFTVIAYTVDTDGMRRLTTDKITVPANVNTQCTLTGLLSEVNYTVCVMPNSKYIQTGKSTFTTSKYSNSYSKYEIIRFLLCSPSAKDSLFAHPVASIHPDKPYKASLIFTGKASQEERFNLRVYITDGNGNVISDRIKKNVPANPNNDLYYVYRSTFISLRSPPSTGEYYVYAAIDNETVYRIRMTVTQPE